MQKLDYERAFKAAGLYEIPNHNMQTHALVLLTEMCITALQGRDWKPSNQDREFSRTIEFITLETRFIKEICRQKIALMKEENEQKTTREPAKSEPSPIAEKQEEPKQPFSHKKLEEPDWLYEMD